MAAHSEFVIKFGIITVSDTASNSPNADKSGPHLLSLITSSHHFKATETETTRAIVPDDADIIEQKLKDLADLSKCDIVITTGGTGFTPRDVTPEATAKVIEKRADGMATALLLRSLEATSYAMLSRGVCGIRGSTLIVNLPGSVKAVDECWRVLEGVLAHAVKQLRGRIVEVKAEHLEMQLGSGSADVHHHHHHGHQQEGDRDQHQHHRHVQHEHHHRRHHQHQEESTGARSQVNESQVAGRPRHSPYPQITVEQAVARVLAEAARLQPESVGFENSIGRVLAEDVVAGEPLPPFPASVKDGYAVRAADGTGRRRVVDAITAGDEASTVLEANCAIRVSTGGPVPSGADAVIQVEDTALVEASPDLTKELVIDVLKPVTVGQDIRPIGSDIAKGALVLTSGTRVGPCELGLLASIGCRRVSVYQMPTVGIASTGNELMDPVAEPASGAGGAAKIRDSNRCTLKALLTSHGFPVIDLGIIPDTADSLVRVFENAIKSCHVIVTTGGVSMGERDLVKQVLLTDFKATLHFAQVFMKPGKPTSFATLDASGPGRKVLFLGLPGNPVSAFVTASLYLIPACRQIAGWREPNRTLVNVRLAHEIRLDPRPEYHRCHLQWANTGSDLPLAWSTGSQMSSRLLSCQSAAGLLILPARSDSLERLPEGHVIKCMLLDAP